MTDKRPKDTMDAPGTPGSSAVDPVEIIRKLHGGFEPPTKAGGATDAHCRAIWNSLPTKKQAEYRERFAKIAGLQKQSEPKK